MKLYHQTSENSCVYDAFKYVGIPVEDWMKNGVLAKDVFDILDENGYTVYRTGCHINSNILKNGFFIIWDNKISGRKISHIEYHIGIDLLLSMKPVDIGAIAVLL
jgi:hypothetical protein